MFSTMKNITTEQRLQKAVMDIMSHPRYTALAGVMMIGNRSVEDDPTKCDTAYTNGRDEVYGRGFVDSLNDAELRFLILHEVYHKLYRHLTTWGWMFKQNPELANQACDYVINVKHVDDNTDGFATMSGPLKVGCFDAKYRGWDSAKVYKDLLENNQGSVSQGTGFDVHGWEDAQEMTQQEKQDLAREIDEAVRQGALMAGKAGVSADRSLDDLLQPQVDWRDALRDFVINTCAGSDYSTWRKPNRRYIGAGVYLPSGISETLGDLVIAVDASGSTYAPGVLSSFLSEAKAICDTVKPSKVHILYWDTAIRGAESYNQDELDKMIESTKPKGGGGTSVGVVGRYLQDNNINPQAVVVLTDGYLGGNWGSWSMPVLWCIIDNKSAKPNCGSVVHIATHAL